MIPGRQAETEMNQPTSGKPTPLKPRRRWRSYFLQFSLRTLLGVTTLSAIGCWWFLQLKIEQEELAGKYLTLRRQVRATKSPKLVQRFPRSRPSRPPAFGN